ncbi:MAG TPA: asparagine synthase (glutamine-hydrolyzing) [Pyrinomonadaceae bacterium]|jgi:asparagine synthase (glutamine-hydrolysing)|nr:asparagine synthase (glutamine-hydrolyzing) [Pyrinomonadaceae bacterium]
MCGIVGLIDAVAGTVPPPLLWAMRDVMFNRGPDGEGEYLEGSVGMAMRRLSIIDPAGGWQPFFSRGGEVVAFQNGEIYNYRELKRQLEAKGHRFSTESDTEVLAHGYTEWGAEELLKRIDGMFAIAILDRGRKELHLARDRFGEKPLFYACAESRFGYSSNLLALAALPWVSDQVDPESLNRYVALHYVPGEATILKSVRRVLPGERLVVPLDDPKPRRFRYYTPSLRDERNISDGEMFELLDEAVGSRLVADVPVGVFLSGGLDSSLIASVAARKKPNIATFSMGFSSSAHDESPYAKLVAKAVGSRHHHFQFDEKTFRSLLPKVVHALDEPIGDQALLPLYWLCQEARRHVTVALSGEGADEIFAGYGYYRRFLAGNGWRGRLKARLGLLQSAAPRIDSLTDNAEPISPSGFPLLTDRAGRHSLMNMAGASPDEWERGLFAWLNDSADTLRRATATDLATWLPDDLLVKFDRMSMAHSLEGRAPYLHPKLVEAGLRLGQAQKIKGEDSKVVLRRIARRWLPQEILERPKKGFVLPMAEWLSQWFAAQPSVHDYFLMRPVPGLDAARVANLVEHDLSVGVQRERLLLALVLLIEWYQSFKSRQYQLTKEYREAAGAGSVR